MKILTRDELKSLAQTREEPCFSFYLNTAKAGQETLINPVRFRSLIRKAHDRLTRAGAKASDVARLLAPAIDLLDDYLFWQDQDLGLAVFLSGGNLQAYKIPYDVAPEVIDGGNFHLKPLLPLFAYDGEFFILALSKNAVELYQASRYTIQRMSLKNVPQSEVQALRFDDPEKSLQVHAGQPGSRGEETVIVHGHGGIRESAKDRTLRFFQQIDRGLHPLLKDQRSPLLLAGVAYYLPIYREANTYPNLVNDIIAGNPLGRTPDQLRNAAWNKLEPLFEQARTKATAAIEAGLAKEQATDRLEDAVIAASHGRVDKCLVALNEHRWGTYDENNARVQELDRDDRYACDLLDFTAIQTILHGGEVYPMDGGNKIPGHSPVAVLYRF